MKDTTDIDKFWFEDPNIIFSQKEMYDFFPAKNMTFNQQLNSYTRLAFYLSIIMFTYSGNYHYLFIIITTLIFTYLIYKNSREKQQLKNNIERFGDEHYPVDYVYPSKDNPFMNPTLSDYSNNPNRKAVNQFLNKNIRNEIDNKFNINLYKDLDDIFDKKNSQRQYYTVPVTTIPNDQKKFANWLYNTPDTCKEGNGEQCVANNYNPTYQGSKGMIDLQ